MHGLKVPKKLALPVFAAAVSCLLFAYWLWGSQIFGSYMAPRVSEDVLANQMAQIWFEQMVQENREQLHVYWPDDTILMTHAGLGVKSHSFMEVHLKPIRISNADDIQRLGNTSFCSSILRQHYWGYQGTIGMILKDDSGKAEKAKTAEFRWVFERLKWKLVEFSM